MDINARNLHFTLTEKLCAAVIKSVRERYDEYDKLCAEYENIDEEKVILKNIVSDLRIQHSALKQLRAICLCNSDHHKHTTSNEQILTKLEAIFNGIIEAIKVVDISVTQLPPNMRAVMLKIKTNQSNEEHTKIENNNDNNEKLDNLSDEELLATVQMLIMRINAIKTQNDLSKRLNEVAIELRSEYEVSISHLKQTMATCHCAEDKKGQEETVARTSNELKHWEKQYASLKSGRNAAIDQDLYQSANQQQSEQKSELTTTVERVVSSELVSDTQLKRDKSDNEIKKKFYICRVSGCHYVGLSLAELFKHKRQHHKLKKYKSYSIAKQNSVEQNDVMPAENGEKINQSANQQSINIFDEIIDNALIGLNHCAGNSPQIGKQLSHKTTPKWNQQFKCQFPGCRFAGEDGIELKSHVQTTHKSNQRSVNPCKCYYPRCDFVGLNRVMLSEHIANQHNQYHTETRPKLFA